MFKEDVKRTIFYAFTYSLGGIVALILLNIFKEQNYLTGNKIVTIIVIATIGSFIGTKIRKFSKKN